MEKFDKRKIPKGLYCYKIIGSVRLRNNGKKSINIKYCPYYVKKEKKGHLVTFCKFLNLAVVDRGSTECLLWDGCKECGIKIDEREEKMATSIVT